MEIKKNGSIEWYQDESGEWLGKYSFNADLTKEEFEMIFGNKAFKNSHFRLKGLTLDKAEEVKGGGG